VIDLLDLITKEELAFKSSIRE